MLSNLITEKLEQYGGIDLKKNHQKYFRNALGISIGIHLLVMLLYLGWNLFANDDSHIPHIRIHSIAELAPPPSTQDKPEEAQPVAPPPPSDVVKPNLGVPVPVPDAVAPQLTLPDLNQPAPAPAVVSNGPVTSEAPKLVINEKPVEEKDPDPNEYVYADQEPEIITPVDKLIVYPEVAKRSGLEGDVECQILVGKDGHVEQVKVIKADYELFKQAAIDAMLKARYTPATANKVPMKFWTTYKVHFRIK